MKQKLQPQRPDWRFWRWPSLLRCLQTNQRSLLTKQEVSKILNKRHSPILDEFDRIQARLEEQAKQLKALTKAIDEQAKTKREAYLEMSNERLDKLEQWTKQMDKDFDVLASRLKA